MTRDGFTILELLIVIAIVGILAAVTVISGRGILQAQEEQATVHAFRQATLRASTAASARNAEIWLIKQGTELRLEDLSDNRVFQTYELSSEVASNLDDGTLLVFYPSGKASTSSFSALPSPVEFTTDNKTYQVTLSLIGETKVITQ